MSEGEDGRKNWATSQTRPNMAGWASNRSLRFPKGPRTAFIRACGRGSRYWMPAVPRACGSGDGHPSWGRPAPAGIQRAIQTSVNSSRGYHDRRRRKAIAASVAT